MLPRQACRFRAQNQNWTDEVVEHSGHSARSTFVFVADVVEAHRYHDSAALGLYCPFHRFSSEDESGDMGRSSCQLLAEGALGTRQPSEPSETVKK